MELKADFTKAFPGGTMDDSTFEAVEHALDLAGAETRAEDGRWLTLPERVASLAAELAEADAVVARNFPTAKSGTVRDDTLRCVNRHRERIER